MVTDSVQSTTASDSKPANSNAGNTTDMFMTLLVAQLKNQDPTSPMDPTQFVGQLTQFNSLNELIKIRQLLQGATTTSSSASQSTGGL